MSKIIKTDLFPLFEKLHSGKILVVGDLAIDEMVYGETTRISREAPVLILKHSATKIILGTGANAANNIAALKPSKVSVVGVCGDDHYAGKMLEAFKASNIDISGIVKDPSRPTTTKTRISAASAQSVTQQIVRIDRESNVNIYGDIEERILENIERLAPEHDAILLSDYGICLMTERVINHARYLAKKYNLILAVDAQKQLQRFQDATILTPNQPEAEETLGYKLTDMHSVISGGFKLLEITNAKMLLITRGSEGMILFERNGTVTTIPAYNKTDVFDVTGAGDTVVGTLILALASGIDPKSASVLGNLAASIVVKQFGAAVTSCQEIKDTLEKLKFQEIATFSVIKEELYK